MLKSAFEPCIPTRGTKVLDRPEWIHEIKHDGYRLIVQRDGKRVRLFTRNGHDWSDRFPLISEAARRNRNSSFVLDGETVLLGVDGRSDFNGPHSRKHDDEVAHAITQPAKRIPQWLTIDLLVIVVSLATISIWIWIGP
jgi:bifunctional non-homologous end joining protein LigD